METKKEIRFFFLPDFEKEEDYLAAKHRQGWKFVKGGFIYHFKKCPSEEVVYKLDFKPDDQDKSEYIQLFKDYGWEYVSDCNHFSYFRKTWSQGDMEIYSDRQSKLDMIGRIIGKQFLLACSLFAAFSLLFYSLNMPWALLGMTIPFVPVLVYCLVGLLRLRKKYREVG